MTSSPVSAAILAGGLATRLRPLSETIPKSLIDVNGEPFIAHQLRLLRENQIERVVLCVGYLGEEIQEIIGDGARFDLQVEYSFDGAKLIGTAGALKGALPLLPDGFLVLYGDSYLDFDYQAAWRCFQASNKLSLMTVFANEGRWENSNVEYDGVSIISYDKQNATRHMRYVDYGLGIFKKEAFDFVPTGQPHDLARLYQGLLKQNQLAAFEVRNRFYEIGSVSGLQETRHYLASRSKSKE
jgi:N-acetyl-alpha-D-muramate 1-phosphate uridylyltransferase